MGCQALFSQLPTSYCFRPDGNIGASGNPQRHRNRLKWIEI